MKKFFTLLFFTGFVLFTLPLFGQIRVTFPCDLSSYMNKEIEIVNPLYVTNNYYLIRNGSLTLSSSRLRAGTEVALPASDAYQSVVSGNISDCLTLLPATGCNYYDSNGGRRNGSLITGLRGYVRYQYGGYAIQPTVQPSFSADRRPEVPQTDHPYDVKVVSANLQYYIADPAIWALPNNRGASNRAEFNRQRSKTGEAFAALNADIYALCEVGEGDMAIRDLAALMNEKTGSNRFKYVSDNNHVASIYTKNGFVYDSQKVKPYGELLLNEIDQLKVLNKRRVAIGFELLSTGERFIVNMNHFLSKSSSMLDGDEDSGDGQGKGKATRLTEAREILGFVAHLQDVFDDEDVLIVGDLNSYSMEDPIRLMEHYGLVNQTKRFVPQKYSYAYKNEVGYLDHVLATPSMNNQIACVDVWHVNADEPAYFSYDNPDYCDALDPGRYADHDPLVTFIRLGTTDSFRDPFVEKPVVSGSYEDGFIIVKAPDLISVSLFDSFGRLCHTEQNMAVGSSFMIPVMNLNKGCYFIRAISIHGISSLKIIF